MFHVQALVALFSGTEAAPWVANEWTRGVRLGGGGVWGGGKGCGGEEGGGWGGVSWRGRGESLFV